MTYISPFPGGNENWPSTWGGCRVRARFTDFNGFPLAGSVRFTPEVTAGLTPDRVVLPAPITVLLDHNGEIDVLIPASDDPNVTPVEFTYHVREFLDGGRGYHIEAPLDGDINLALVSPVPSSTGKPITRGPAGPSAYEAARAAGFAGTESQWLSSLVGPQGPAGAPGSGGGGGGSADVIIAKSAGLTRAIGTTGSEIASNADAGAVLTAAIAHLGAAGGRIEFKKDTYTWSTVPALPANLNGWLTILGSGSIITLSYTGRRFLDFNRQANGDTFRYLHVEGFDIDFAVSSTLTGMQHVALGTARHFDDFASGVRVNFQDITIRKVNTYNVRSADSGVAHNLNIFLAVHHTAAGQPQNTMKRIVIDECTFMGGNQGAIVYAGKGGAFAGDIDVYLDDITITNVKHDRGSDPTVFDYNAHVHIASLGRGGRCQVRNIWGRGSRDVAVEVDGMMDTVIENVVAVNYLGFAVALTNYHAVDDHKAQRFVVRDISGYRTGGIAAPSASSVVGIRTEAGMPAGHFVLENLKHYRSATAPNLASSPLAGDLVSVKGSIESLTIDGANYEAVGAAMSGTGSAASQIIYIDDLTSVRTRITIKDVDIRFRGANSSGATATQYLVGIQLNGDVDAQVSNVRMYVDWPGIAQLNAVDLGGASGGTMRGRVRDVRLWGPNLGSNAKGVYVPGSSTVTVPYIGALLVEGIEADVPVGSTVYIGPGNEPKVDQGNARRAISAFARTITADTSITDADGVIFLGGSGSVTATLPSATYSGGGKQFLLVPTGSAVYHVNALGGNVDGAGEAIITTARTFVSDGTNWKSIAGVMPAERLAGAIKTANYSLTQADGSIFVNGSGLTMTLPSATISGAGRAFSILNVGSTVCSVNAAGGNVNGIGGHTIEPGGGRTFVSDGTHWWAAVAPASNGGGATTHNQSTPASTWSITYSGAGSYPGVTVYVAGEQVIADVQYAAPTITVTFPTPTSGAAVIL